MRLDRLLPGAESAPDDLDHALTDAANAVASDLAPGRGSPSPPRAAAIATQTRAAAESAITQGSTAPDAVVRSLLTRDWLLAVAEMVDARP